jgi:hypothetical protein
VEAEAEAVVGLLVAAHLVKTTTPRLVAVVEEVAEEVSKSVDEKTSGDRQVGLACRALTSGSSLADLVLGLQSHADCHVSSGTRQAAFFCEAGIDAKSSNCC